MTSPQKRRGDAWERAVVVFLREHGQPYAERSYGAGRPTDVGDIDGLPRWVFEAKAHKVLDLAGWVDEAERERAAAGVPFGVVIAKRRGRPVGDAYVVLTLTTFADLLTEGDES